MYHYLENKSLLKKTKTFCSNLLKELEIELRNNHNINSQFFLVGSGGRNMVSQNANEPFDLDYNLNILSCPNWKDEKYLRETVKKTLNKLLESKNLCDVDDSTSSLKIKQLYFKDHKNSNFSVDIAIVTLADDGLWYKIKHKKTGFSQIDEYFWNAIPNSNQLKNKEILLKQKNLWEEVRNTYLVKKNMYLTRNDDDHPSFICYIEAVNEVYYKHFK